MDSIDIPVLTSSELPGKFSLTDNADGSLSLMHGDRVITNKIRRPRSFRDSVTPLVEKVIATRFSGAYGIDVYLDSAKV